MRATYRDAEAWAWESFAFAHPVEAHEQDADRFWSYFQRMRPGVSRGEMEALLREHTEGCQVKP